MNRNVWAQRVQIAFQQLKLNMMSDRMKTSTLELTRPQMIVLYTLNGYKKCKLTQLAEKIEVKPSAITVMIDRLEKLSYVKRSPDPSDRRVIMVELTSLGEMTLEKALQEMNDILQVYLQRLSSEELKTFTELFEKVAAPRQESDPSSDASI